MRACSVTATTAEHKLSTGPHTTYTIGILPIVFLLIVNWRHSEYHKPSSHNKLFFLEREVCHRTGNTYKLAEGSKKYQTTTRVWIKSSS